MAILVLKKYLPLLLVEFYLLSTLLIFLFGPIDFNIRNFYIFFILLILYHAGFIGGYLVALGKQTYTVAVTVFSPRKFWLLFCFGLLGVLLTYNNLMLSEVIIPYDFFENLSRGFTEPGLVYSERMMMESGVSSGSRIFNIFSILFSFAKLLFIFYSVYFWREMKFNQKTSSVLYFFFFISSGVSAGVNSVVFIFFIFIIFSILTVLRIKNSLLLGRAVIGLTVLFLIPVSSFGYIMSQRGGGIEYFAGTSPLGDISVDSSFKLNDEPSVIDFLYYSFFWLDYYLTQGYYGFSLILDLDWKWTFGFGNSAFLQRQFLLLTGSDISQNTFQARISHYWDDSAQWHSFYGQFANDFGLVGVIVFMFVLGYMFSRVWQAALVGRSFFASALIPIFVIMFIFIPANNQVFAYIDMLSYFIFVSVFWFFEGRKIRI